MKVIDQDIRKVVPNFREKDFDTKLFVITFQTNTNDTYIAYVYRTSHGKFNLRGINIEKDHNFYDWRFECHYGGSLLKFMMKCVNYWTMLLHVTDQITIYILENMDDAEKFSCGFTKKSDLLKDHLTEALQKLISE